MTLYRVLPKLDQAGLYVAEIPVLGVTETGMWIEDPRDGEVFIDNRIIADFYRSTKELAIEADISWNEARIRFLKESILYHENYLANVRVWLL